MDIEKMSNEGAMQTVNEICDGMKKFVTNNPESAKELLVVLIPETLDMLAQDDFFGTEGWEHAFGIEY